MMLSMHTPSTRPWRNTILLFCSLFVFLSAPIILAEEGGEAQGSPPMSCEEIFRLCEGESRGDSRLWEDCVGKMKFECLGETIDGATTGDACRDAYELCARSYGPGPRREECLGGEAKLMEQDPQCPNRWKEWGLLDESPVFVPLPASGDEWNRGGWGEGQEGQKGESREWDEGGSDEEEGRDGEDEDGEEQEEEKWLETVQENLDGIEDEATRKCIEETIRAKEKRCEVSSIEGCAAKTAFKTLATEGKCGGAIFGIAEFDESGAGEDHDFQKSFEEHREGGGGCVPFHATLEGVKAEMSGRTPEEIIEEFERRKHWMAKMATDHGGNPEEMLREYDSFHACDDGGPGGGHQGPPMGMPGMMGSREGMQGPSVGEIFGRAVGMLVELSQRPELSDEQKTLIRETLAWFSDALNRVGAGEDVSPLAADAREKLENLMAAVGGGSFMDGPNIEMMRSEIERMLEMGKMMIEKIPQAMAMMVEMGHAVEGWEPLFAEIKELAAKVEEICREQITQASSPDQVRECFDAMHMLFEEKMNAMGDYVGKSVPPEAMRDVEGKMGFDKMGMPGEHRGPPSGMDDNRGAE